MMEMRTAQDKFESYYSEKLWELIPAIYRHEDGLANPKNVLRGLITVMAEQAAILRRSQDRLWDDQFIELCDDWAIPYIADLVATRLLSAKNKRGRRIDVAKTIYYRRRKGTPRILEELISDISGWKGKLVESFHHLARTRHFLDPKPTPYAGRFTGTMPGGLADLRNPAGSELAGGPFDEYFHTPDFRKPRGKDGRYGITKLNFHLYRLISYQAVNVDPCSLDSTQQKYTFDPSGRGIPLFNKDAKPFNYDWEQWHSSLEWELPLPIRCRLLGHAEFVIKEIDITGLALLPSEKEKLRRLKGIQFRSEGALRKRIDFITDENVKLELLKGAIIMDCGKNQLWPSALMISSGSPPFVIPKEKMGAANSGNNNTDSNKDVMVDAERGKFLFNVASVPPRDLRVSYNYGFAGPCGAGFYDRKMANSKAANLFAENRTIEFLNIAEGDVAQVRDSLTYIVAGDIMDIKDFTLQSANQQRPFIRLERNWIFSAGTNEDSRLIIDGLWIGSFSATGPFKIILQGDFECIVIRNCSFDPGGIDAEGNLIQPVSIEIDGQVENLCIENCIMGPVALLSSSIIDETITISDSIVQSQSPAVYAIEAENGKTEIRRSTILGGISVHRLYATDTIITGIATVTDTQTGCFRFSTAPFGSRLPRPYESLIFDLLLSNDYWFTSRVFGDPGYAQLSVLAPTALYRGAENGAEMGVFNNLLNAIKFDGLQSKVEEYMPFGLIPGFVNET
jgi:hypothetical protein